jgi:hypothetical protein
MSDATDVGDQVISRDAYGNRKYEDDLDDAPEWEWPSDEEEFQEKLTDLRDGVRNPDTGVRDGDDTFPVMLDQVVRDKGYFQNAHVGGWSAANHTKKAKEVPPVPIKFDKLYEITNLPLDDWGFFELSVERPDALKITVTLHRLRNDCDPVLFIRYGQKPSQQEYEACTYDTWEGQEETHELEVASVNEGKYYIGIWNTPIFGRHDAAFKVCRGALNAPSHFS